VCDGWSGSPGSWDRKQLILVSKSVQTMNSEYSRLWSHDFCEYAVLSYIRLPLASPSTWRFHFPNLLYWNQIFVSKLPRVLNPTFPHHRCSISVIAGLYPFMAVTYTTGLIVAIHLAFGAVICLFLLMAKKLHSSTHKCSNPFSRLIPRRSRSELPVIQPQPNLWLSKYEQAYSRNKQNPALEIENYHPYARTNAGLTTPVAALLPFPQN